MRTRRIVAVAIVAALAPAAPAQEQPPAQPTGPTVLSLTKSALAKRDAGDMKGAVEDLTKALALAPKNASLLHERAVCRTKLGDAEGVAADLKKAAASSPKDYPVDVALWREAVETARAAGGSAKADIGLIQAEVAGIRGKPFKSDVESDSQSPKEFGERVDQSIDREMPKAKRDDVQAALHRLGLVPGDFDIRREVTGALMSQAAAYYDTKRKKFFNLMSGMPPALIEATAAHELVHALQDQYFDLDAWFAAHDPPSASGLRDDDRTLALRCVVEGEATYVQTIWQMEHVMKMTPGDAVKAARRAMPTMAGMEVEDLVHAAKRQNGGAPAGSEMAKALEEMDKIEPYVMAPLLAAYMTGASLVAAADDGPEGWASVDRLYADPPLSSEQCLHPDKYTGIRDAPTPIAVPELPDVTAAGWRVADAAIHGELYLGVLLKRHGAAAPLARKAAAGWDGDMYRGWRAEDGRTAFVLATTWDTEMDATEFFDAYRATLAKKYEKLAEEKGSDLSSLRYTYGAESLGTGALVLRGNELFAVEGFAAGLREKVVAALVEMKVEHVE